MSKQICIFPALLTGREKQNGFSQLIQQFIAYC